MAVTSSATNPTGRNIWFGIREHAMGAICNGIAYDGLFLGSCATFLVFADYCRPSIRIAALAKLPVTYIFTHDSVGVGEDGPTHQPVETVSGLRVIPNLDVIRPGDAKKPPPPLPPPSAVKTAPRCSPSAARTCRTKASPAPRPAAKAR
jgi:transketolase